jgi:subtilisin family serine protease
VLKPGADARAVANEHAAAHAAAIAFVYSHALNGYAATIPNARLAAIQADERVAYVEPDGEMNAVAQTVPYGIAKIGADVSSTRAGDGAGAVSNVNAYIIDTGIDATHADPERRRPRQLRRRPEPRLQRPRHSRRRQGGRRRGQCERRRRHRARRSAHRGQGARLAAAVARTPRVIAGIDWVTANAVKAGVANMSLGGSVSQAVDGRRAQVRRSGVFYALAAGNGRRRCVRPLARLAPERGRTMGS